MTQPRTRLLVRLALTLSLLLASACVTPAWTMRAVPGCAQAIEPPGLEQERGYLAALLALDSRGYAITRALSPEIEAVFVITVPVGNVRSVEATIVIVPDAPAATPVALQTIGPAIVQEKLGAVRE